MVGSQTVTTKKVQEARWVVVLGKGGGVGRGEVSHIHMPCLPPALPCHGVSLLFLLLLLFFSLPSFLYKREGQCRQGLSLFLLSVLNAWAGGGTLPGHSKQADGAPACLLLIHACSM